MFDMIFGNSYIVVNYTKYYLDDTYYDLKQKMNDDSDTITVSILDSFTGIFTDVKTFNKSDISDYGSN